MLEFQEGFFEQEVRDGFYLDSTMKTVWAAELEVLQKIAEVCDRHGIKWYAAYGTLLGAVRHEGFIPWDDDMDIWVKRPDYNRLMKLLPVELPAGYRVRGPLAEEGYEQFHTCVNSGSGISIAKDWLEQFHGCPFTVGLDIFPLDYLPRDEHERELQNQLFALTGRIAQLAKNIGRGEYDSTVEESEKAKAREDAIKEVYLGIEYLEENCRLNIDHQLLEDEKWEQLCSELWRWGNYLAMMYSEEESDYLVEYLDYVQCSHKIYPKEWFEDGYSAAYENFMIPIPSGYHEILNSIYGNYQVCIKKTGMHEYPYYARQLVQLREYVKSIEERKCKLGLMSIEDIEIKEKPRELPAEWIPYTVKEDGTRKMFVLSANDSVMYAECGDKALDSLERMFDKFEQMKDLVLLWWRPQPVMKNILDQVSPQLGERYQRILDHYKEAGWGICDETDNIDRAVEACDIYYGNMNAVLQPFQDAGKPIVLNAVKQDEIHDASVNNAGRINECRSFLSLTDYVEDAGRIYFASTNYNALVVVDRETWTVVKHIPFTEAVPNIRNMHLQSVRLENWIYFLPAEGSYLHLYNMENGTQKSYRFPEESETTNETWGYFSRQDQIYLLPSRAKQGLWSVQAQTDEPIKETWWKLPEEAVLKHDVLDSDRFYTLAQNSNRLYITNVKDRTVESFSLSDEQVIYITFDGRNFWYASSGTSDIVCWNCKQGFVDRYQGPCDSTLWNGIVTYTGIYFAGNHLFLISGAIVYVLDPETREVRKLHDRRLKFFGHELSTYCKCTDKYLICFMQNAGEVLMIDLETLEVKQHKLAFGIDQSIKQTVQDYVYRILLDRKALLMEDDIVDLELVLQYCSKD